VAPLNPRDGAGPVVIVGGGITGLAAAHRLVETQQGAGRAPRVLVLEADTRLGGQIRTERGGGFVLEGGPDALVAQKPAGVRLCERLGLGPELADVSSPNPGTQIYLDGRLRRVPDGFLMMAPTRIAPVLASRLFSWRGKMRMAIEPWVARRAPSVDDESLASFVTRRFGREVLDRVAEPVMAGLFTADADRLSLRMTMARFLDLEAESGSVTRGLRAAAASSKQPRPFGHGTGRSGFVSVSGGLARIVETLAARLPEGAVRLGARVRSVTPRGGPEGWTVELADGDMLHARAVLFACPAGEVAKAVAATDDALATALRRLRYASCATVNIAYPKAHVGARLDGLGFFVPRTERLPILACSYVTEKFPGRAPEGIAVFRAFLGGATRPDALDATDDGLIRDTDETLRRILAISGAPVLAKAFRSPRAMPQFEVGSRATIDGIAARASAHAGLFVAGSIAGAFGLPDCIRSGEESADRVSAFLESSYGMPESEGWVAYQANQNA